MMNSANWIWEVGAAEFVVVTGILGGMAAFMTGRAVAQTWRSKSALVLYTALLSLAVRFIHFSLFGGTLLAPWYFIVDLLVLLAIGFCAMRITRSRQMSKQYGFAYERLNRFGWRRRSSAS